MTRKQIEIRKRRGISTAFKAFTFLLLLCLPFSAFAETYDIETPDGTTVKLDIPSSYSALRRAYIEVSKLYIGERHDLEIALELIEDQEVIIEDLEEQIEELIDVQDKLLAENESLRNQQITPIQQIVSIDSAMKFDRTFIGSGNFGFMFFESFFVTLKVGYPLSLGLQLGYSW